MISHVAGITGSHNEATIVTGKIGSVPGVFPGSRHVETRLKRIRGRCVTGNSEIYSPVNKIPEKCHKKPKTAL